jgi:hypothetical protein
MSFDLDEAMLKYKRKEYFVKLRPQFEAIGPSVRDNAARAQIETTRTMEKVKRVINTEGVLSDYHMIYTAYGLALDKSQRTLEFMVDRIREHEILRTRFEGFGALASVLDKIDAILIWNNVSP